MSEPQEPQSPDDPSPDVPSTPMTRREAREAARANGGGLANATPPSAPSPGATSANETPTVRPTDDGTPTVAMSAEPAPTVAMGLDELAGLGVAGQAAGGEAPTAAASAAAKPATARRGGISALIAKHPNAWLFSALGVVFVMLGTGAVFAGSSFAPEPTAVVAPSPSPTMSPTPRPVPATPAAATRLRTCSIAGLAADPRLGTFEGSVLNAKTGEVLFDRSASKPAPTASVMKTLIAATALKILGPDHRLSTKVYAGSQPGSVVLVGGGDPTLSAGNGSVYANPPTLKKLAAQVEAAREKLGLKDPITSIILDSTMWNNSDAWDPSWPETERTHGYQPLIVPLMVDGDRADPRRQNSPRSKDPVAAAGEAFRTALGLHDDVDFSRGSAITTNPLLGEVKSQPVKTLIGEMLPVSDNTLAEMLARVSSKVGGRDGSAASLTAVVSSALTNYGITATDLTIKDGSGESKNDAVPPIVVAQLMTKVLSGADNLGVIYKALPISGRTGTLAGRFTGPNAVARGAVNAKTGSILAVYTLGGIVHAADGTPLAFAFYALGNVRSTAMTAIDTVTTGVFKCGDNLSNN